MSNIPGWLTREEAADRVGRKARTIRDWQKNGLRTAVGLIPETELLEFDRAKRAQQGRPVKPGSILRRFVGGNYAAVFASLTSDERATLADELLEVAEVLTGRAA